MIHVPRQPRHARVPDSTLHVVAVVSNPARFESRYRLYEDFAARLREIDGVHLVTVEHAHGDRRHEVTALDRADHVQVRGSDELWLKENLINLGVRALGRDWKYVAWVDADIEP